MVQRNKFNINTKKNEIDFSVNYGPFRIPNKVFDNIKISPKILSVYPSYHANSIIKPMTNFLNLKIENIILTFLKYLTCQR